MLVLASRSPVLEKVQGNIEEVAARGGRLIAVTELDNLQVRNRVESVKTSPIGLWLFWPGAAGWQPARAARPI